MTFKIKTKTQFKLFLRRLGFLCRKPTKVTRRLRVAKTLNPDGTITEYDSPIFQMPENAYGFVYIIRNKITGKYYIGKKALEFNRKKKLTKKELAEHVGPGRKPTSRTVTTESDWLDYWGSNKNLLGDLREFNKENFTRQILVYAFNKKQLTYYEVHYQCISRCS